MLFVFLKILILVGLGFLSRKLNLLKAEDVKPLNNIVIHFTLPALIFLLISQSPFSLELIKVPLMADGVAIFCMVCAYFIARLLKLSRQATGSFVVAVGIGNTAFLGFPIISGLLGEKALLPAIFFDQFSTVIVGFTVGAWVAARFGEGEEKVNPILTLLKFPPLWGLALGLLFHMVPAGMKQVLLPSFLEETLVLLKQTTVPLIMFSLGLTLQPRKVKEALVPVAIICILKLFVFPFLVFAGGKGLGITPATLKVTTLESGMPTAMLALTLAIRYKLDIELTSRIIFVCMLLSLGTLPLIFKLLS